MLMRFAGVGLVAVLGAAAFASADTIAINQGTVVGHQAGGPYSLGRYFEVGAAGVDITNLGAFDSGQDGLTAPVTVSIYSTANHATPVVTGTLTTANSTLATSNGFRFLNTPITPVQLATGEYIVVASPYGTGAEVDTNTNESNGAGGNDPAPTYNTGGGLISFPGASTETGTASAFATTVGTYPTNGDNGLYGAGSFTFTAVPEPATLALMSLGTLNLLARRRPRV